MTEIIIAFVPFLAAVAFFIRARGELGARRAAERELADLKRAGERKEAYQREWLATLTHELRSPAGAVLGYSELLADGMLGPIDDRAADALRRIRASTEQLLVLIDGISRSVRVAPAIDDELRDTSAADVLRHAAESLAADAASRDVQIVVDQPEFRFITRPDDFRHVIELALGAAVKASPGTSLRMTAALSDRIVVAILHTRLDPLRDDPDRIAEAVADHTSPSLSGPAVRIGIARIIAETSLGGDLRLDATPDGCTVIVDLPVRSSASTADATRATTGRG